VVRPEGPLAAELWPASLVADGAGIVHVPPLERGKHTVRVKGAAGEQGLVIPALGGDKPVALRIEVE
jgi:hypothetical protein